MKIIDSVSDFIELRSQIVCSVGFVPTMGALHSGHISLIKKSNENCDLTVVSIFVNPTQFNNPDDLIKYPNTLEKDIQKLIELGVDYLFLPNFDDMYPDDYKYRVIESDFSLKLCGKNRPGHFDGVLSVVMKLLNIVRPGQAFFGEKDFQQLSLIKGMVQAFFMNVEIISVATVREVDGLAMSSRNLRLSVEARERAPLIYKELKSASDLNEKKNNLEMAGFEVDYIEQFEDRIFVAAKMDDIRLIDNVEK